MGNPDLSTTVVDAIRAGDADAIAEFYDGHSPRVKAYCEVACQPELVSDAASAAFVDFLARVAEQGVADDQLEDLLLRACRSAAAARASVSEDATQADCRPIPELLAARANGELSRAHAVLDEHLAQCERCQETAARMARAERAFAGEVEPAAPAPEPEPAAPARGPAPVLVRRRQGGLVGALKSRFRQG